MASTLGKKRTADGRLKRVSKKQARQRQYNSDSDKAEDDFNPVNLLDSDDDIHETKVDALNGVADEDSDSEDEGQITKSSKRSKSSLIASNENDGDKAQQQTSDVSTDNESNDGSGSDEESDGSEVIGDGTERRPKSKRNDPSAFATSMSKILSTKLSGTKRSDPMLARSAAAREASKAAADAVLESRASRRLRDEKRRAMEKGRVKDVLIATRSESTGEPESSTAGIMETERRLRKVAQRGVVKLFNAVRAAQVRAAEAEKSTQRDGVIGVTQRQEKLNEMTKKGFLELIASGGGNLKKGALEEA